MDDIAAVWDDTDPDDVTSYTDRDLTFSRRWSTRLYDPSGEYRVKATAIADHYELEGVSAGIDLATRVGIAVMIDNNEALVTRDDYDINYMIPPRGWVQTNVRGSIEYDDPQTDEEYIQISMPPTCRDISEEMVEQGTIEKKRELMIYGIDCLCEGQS